MWGSHINHLLHRAKQHVKTIVDFGQKSWDTVGKVVKHGTDILGKVSDTANNFKGLHPIIDDGINFLLNAKESGNIANDMYNQANEKKNKIETMFKEKTTTMVPFRSRTS